MKLGVQWTPKLLFNESEVLEKHFEATQAAALPWRVIQEPRIRGSGNPGWFEVKGLFQILRFQPSAMGSTIALLKASTLPEQEHPANEMGQKEKWTEIASFRAFPGECQGIGPSQVPKRHCQAPESHKKKILSGKDTKRTQMQGVGRLGL